MNNVLNYHKIKIIFVLVFSLFIVRSFSKVIFLANTPRINYSSINRLKKIPKYIADLSWSLTNQNLNNSPDSPPNYRVATKQQLEKLPLRPVSKGVYAGEIGKIKYYKVSQSEIEWSEMELRTKSGRLVKFRYPKDQPPAEEMLDIIKSE